MFLPVVALVPMSLTGLAEFGTSVADSTPGSYKKSRSAWMEGISCLLWLLLYRTAGVHVPRQRVLLYKYHSRVVQA
jgi:hypothetical protein